MLQQSIAVIIIVFFLSRVFWRGKKTELRRNEYYFWLVFWLLALIAVIFIKKIDALVSQLGFSGSGIEVLLYLGVVLLFYLLFKIRIKAERMERNITRLVREIAILKGERDNKREKF